MLESDAYAGLFPALINTDPKGIAHLLPELSKNETHLRRVPDLISFTDLAMTVARQECFLSRAAIFPPRLLGTSLLSYGSPSYPRCPYVVADTPSSEAYTYS